MKHQRDLPLWLVTLVACSGALSVACGDDAGVDPTTGGTTGTAGAAAGAPQGGTSAGSGGAPTTGGAPGAAGTSTIAGTSSTAGTSGGGTGGGGAGGSAGTGGSAGGGAGGGTGTNMPFGIVSCQPAFETACKPNIEFVNGDPGGRGKVFTDVIPDVVATMKDVACTACSILYRDPSEIPQNKHPSTIRLVLDTHGGVAQAGGGQIQFDLNYINGYKDREPAVIKQEMMGVLQHETVHLYQNYGTGGTGEGLADLVRARTGFYPQSRWRSEGDWMTAYTASGNFYSWLTGPCSFHSKAYADHDFDLPYKINKALTGKNGDSASFGAVADLLQTTFGKDVDTLWDEYQADAYGK